MYLLNPSRAKYGNRKVVDLHSTMYLLNRSMTARSDSIHRNLHSTMYLLNPKINAGFVYVVVYLHSTMYLLNLSIFSISKKYSPLFTFHYVSIKLNLYPHLSGLW